MIFAKSGCDYVRPRVYKCLHFLITKLNNWLRGLFGFNYGDINWSPINFIFLFI